MYKSVLSLESVRNLAAGIILELGRIVSGIRQEFFAVLMVSSPHH